MTKSNMGDYNVELGARIAEARNAAGLSQSDLSTRMGLTRSSVANTEAGRQKMRAEQVMAIAEITGSDPRWLLTGWGPMARRSGVDATALLAVSDRLQGLAVELCQLARETR